MTTEQKVIKNKVGLLSTGQKMRRNLLYGIKRSEQMASL